MSDRAKRRLADDLRRVGRQFGLLPKQVPQFEDALRASIAAEIEAVMQTAPKSMLGGLYAAASIVRGDQP